jgi:hypothetical protein
MNRTLMILNERSIKCDIQVYPCIIHSIRLSRVFLTQNHPDMRVMLYLACRCLEALRIPVSSSQIDRLYEDTDRIMNAMPGRYPLEHSSIKAHDINCRDCIDEANLDSTRDYWETLIRDAYEAFAS